MHFAEAVPKLAKILTESQKQEKAEKMEEKKMSAKLRLWAEEIRNVSAIAGNIARCEFNTLLVLHNKY